MAADPAPTPTPEPDARIDGLGYEQARDELVEVVRSLEVGGLSLDDALALWERGERLARRCEQQLAGARDRVDAVLRESEDPDGTTPGASGAGNGRSAR
ncbi:MAG TPA: exodeoxyribonuclease VII small subunit [Pseudonocardia sp.]